MKGKNITIFGLGAIGGFIGGNVFAFIKCYIPNESEKHLLTL